MKKKKQNTNDAEQHYNKIKKKIISYLPIVESERGTPFIPPCQLIHSSIVCAYFGFFFLFYVYVLCVLLCVYLSNGYITICGPEMRPI